MASQQLGVGARTGITADEADAAAWVVADEGVKVGGARAIALALASGRSARWPTLPFKIPGLPWVLDRVYVLVARNRRRLPGVLPWCAEHPDDCKPGPASTS